MNRESPREETSAGGVVFRGTGGDSQVLLIRDSYGNWGFPKGHVEGAETAEAAAIREVSEETGLTALSVRAPLDSIDWYFRFRGVLVHKVCHFFLLEAGEGGTSPQRSEGITDCRWAPFDAAHTMVSYPNARLVLGRARAALGILPAP